MFRKTDICLRPLLAQSAGLRIGAFDDIAEFQVLDLTDLKRAFIIVFRQCRWLAEKQRLLPIMGVGSPAT